MPPTADALDALLARAWELEGLRVAQVAARLGRSAPVGGRSTKGRVGEMIEALLGATGGSGSRSVDFPELEVELKTIPVVGTPARPRESTFVATVDLVEDVDWEQSWVAKKLSRVLFLPVVGGPSVALGERVLGRAVLWMPSPDQRAQLKSDYDDIMGLVGIGRVEDVSAHLGRYLQLRPKARDGSARTIVPGRDGERIATVPRGFYLRATFTAALLSDPAALP